MRKKLVFWTTLNVTKTTRSETQSKCSSRILAIYNCPKVLETPLQPPDINFIKNLWHKFDVKIRERTVTKKEQLKQIT